MKLIPTLIPDWPKLAWVASLEQDSDEIRVLHGPMVETSDDWIVEAVWAGDFRAGDFDQTDLVFGTGIRCRDDVVDFVSSGTTFDQLWYTAHNHQTYVANSLPALMAVARIGLDEDYPHYRRDIHSIKKGLEARAKSIPTNAGTISTVYYNNLRLELGELKEVPKHDSAPDFECYEDYRSYLFTMAAALRENLSSPDRRNNVSTLCSISSGYDSPAAAVVAREVGCTHTVTIKDSSSLWRGSDSGSAVAEALGMSCTEHARTAKNYPLEETIWAACAWGGILNYTLFDYSSPLCLYFTAWCGDMMWDRVGDHSSDPFATRTVGSLGFSEFRLSQGVWQCVVPFWGARHLHQLRRITSSAEMRPWSLGSDYDRPIARRLAEEAGVPRRAFGQIKKNASLPDPFVWPRSPSAQASYQRYLKVRERSAPTGWQVSFIRLAATAEDLLHKNVFHRLGVKKRFRPWARLSDPSAVYCWANEQLTARYTEGLQLAVEQQAVSSAR